MTARSVRRGAATATASMSAAEYRGAVLAVVAAIPPGRVMAYGAIAAYLAELSGRASPRLVGQIMAHDSSDVPWHRVVRESGHPVRDHEAKALRRLLDDGTPVKGARVEMTNAAWAPEAPAAVFLRRRPGRTPAPPPAAARAPANEG